MTEYLKLIRVKHWVKNLLIFLPMICAKSITNQNIKITILGFLSFSLLSSFIYIVNDIRDIDKDKNHPRKKKRPLASGKISINKAIIIGIVLLILSLLILILLEKTFLVKTVYLLLAYLIINIGYSFGLKNIPIIDVTLLAAGFVIRVYYGAALLGIVVSNWLFLMILSVSLFFGLSKRCKEYKNSKASRVVFNQYTDDYLSRFQYLFLGLTIVFYSLWATEQSSIYLLFSIPLIIILLMKYMLVVESNNEGDPVTILYSTKDLLILSIIYAIYMIFTMGVL